MKYFKSNKENHPAQHVSKYNTKRLVTTYKYNSKKWYTPALFFRLKNNFNPCIFSNEILILHFINHIFWPFILSSIIL